MLNCEIINEAVPEFVIVKLCDCDCPSITLPKLKVAGFTANPGCAPVPLRAIVAGEPDALLVTLTVPLATPAAVGANTTLSVRLCDGLTGSGTVAPLSVKPVPLTVICAIWTLVLPVFVIVSLFVEEVPVFTFPNARLVALKESV